MNTPQNVIIDMETWLTQNSLRRFNDNDGAVGDRYLFPEWEKGSIRTKDGVTLEEVPMKYDLVDDMLIAEVNGAYVTLRKINIISFTIAKSDKSLTFLPIEESGGLKYLEVLYEGESALYARHSTKKIAKDAGNQAYGSGVAYDKYVYSKEYFAKRTEGSLEEFKNRKKWAIKFFKGSEDAIESYVKDNMLNLKEEIDLIKLFGYYDSIN